MFFESSKSREEAKHLNMGVSKISDQIPIKIKMPNPTQKPSASSNAPSQDLEDIYILFTFKFKI